ncbi:hypothetical protein [Gordonia otitidis]|uniref:Uncharacterized protein n=1 Tax=Gordonia otitidis (strain DSM 44809 / CCUG 52243 / JCM 12355 / NBRC 100426 / IFM 10032) TaxID=1108044 RepID=H5TRS1_GORO1|nr:hypothetical protein [Gordonia otitidis]GAB36179.1 hypothetical protein GOOTI_202_00350 [Gordonia otitidis NBRC 100426]
MTDEVTESFQPSAECVVCRHARGRGPLTVHLLPVSDAVAIAYATHTRCSAGPIAADMQTTYFIGHGTLVLAHNGILERTAGIVVNPAAELFAVCRVGPNLWGDPLRRHRDAGYRTDNATSSQSPSRLVTWTERGGALVVHDHVLQAQFSVDVPDTFWPLVRKRGGFVYSVSFRHWVAELFSDTHAIDVYLDDDPDGSAHTWVPAANNYLPAWAV